MSPNPLANTPSLEDLDRRHMLHAFTHLADFASGAMGEPRIMVGGDGCHVVDRKGRRYLDGFAGLYCVNVGYGRTEIADAIARQAHGLSYYHAYAGHSSEPAILLAERVIEWAPAGMSRVYFGLSGSDANETQAKIVWYYNNVLGRPAKKKIISRHRGYHGGTVFAGSLTGLPVFHTAFDLPLGPVRHTRNPHHYWEGADGESEEAFSRRCADELEALIQAEGPETVAAFIAEPVLGTGGIIPPPAGYWAAIQPVLRRHDLLLIADEVVCGFGRLGTRFGCDRYGIQPDLLTIAKGLTSAYLPLSGAIVGERVWRVLEEGSAKYGPFGHGYTYSAHPVCAAAALANLDILEREKLTENAASTGAYLQDRLRDRLAGHAHVGEVRGEGLLAAVEFVADRKTKRRFETADKVGARLAAACVERGLIARAMPHGDILGFAPPLVITKAEIDQLVDTTAAAVAAVLG
ncbi:L-2,4-diaminobutyrate transaminase [Stella humosa]|uniref:L-2,4-diaminobutyrate transaminase n=1 Tax=Stella humosa TaxID=94 RepID=A0A3N1KY56_9PROT|nr:aminotransferase [Stella humosa]ROP83126.1 L-2,4-diaminobutyrate transaminase [Stella humosa]BBK30097.1 aspartate aminotransferase family protein [Stella humosa]